MELLKIYITSFMTFLTTYIPVLTFQFVSFIVLTVMTEGVLLPSLIKGMAALASLVFKLPFMYVIVTVSALF